MKRRSAFEPVFFYLFILSVEGNLERSDYFCLVKSLDYDIFLSDHCMNVLYY